MKRRSLKLFLLVWLVVNGFSAAIFLNAFVPHVLAQPGAETDPPSVALDSFVLEPGTVMGSDDVQGTVTLTGAAPFDLEVAIASESELVSHSPSVTVPQGETSASFTLDTFSDPDVVDVEIEASYGDVSRVAIVTVEPINPDDWEVSGEDPDPCWEDVDGWEVPCGSTIDDFEGCQLDEATANEIAWMLENGVAFENPCEEDDGELALLDAPRFYCGITYASLADASSLGQSIALWRFGALSVRGNISSGGSSFWYSSPAVGKTSVARAAMRPDELNGPRFDAVRFRVVPAPGVYTFMWGGSFVTDQWYYCFTVSFLDTLSASATIGPQPDD